MGWGPPLDAEEYGINKYWLAHIFEKGKPYYFKKLIGIYQRHRKPNDFLIKYEGVDGKECTAYLYAIDELHVVVQITDYMEAMRDVRK